ncbi:MAG: phosphotransferase, partial [Thermomicrobiales bacterium]
MPVDEVAIDIPLVDDAAFWSQMLDAFRDELFAFMRPDARATVEKQFGEHLAALENFGWRPALRHGDFGGENLLYDEVAQCLSGVIDFGGVALGDPAVDLAAIEAFHPDLAPAMRPAYPALSAAAALRRA